MTMNNIETFDFGSGPVPAHRHINPSGSHGGWVAETAIVEPTVYMERSARVYDHARVLEDVTINANVRVYGHAYVYGESSLYGNVQVYDRANVGSAFLYLNVRVFDDAKIINCVIDDNVVVCGRSEISELDVDGDVHINNNIWTWKGIPGPPIEDQRKLLSMIADKVRKNPDSLDMNDWHSDCGTTSCLAGWAQILSGRPRSRDNAYKDGVELIPIAAHLFYTDDNVEAKAFLSQFSCRK